MSKTRIRLIQEWLEKYSLNSKKNSNTKTLNYHPKLLITSNQPSPLLKLVHTQDPKLA